MNFKTAEELLWKSCEGISHDQFLEIIESTKEYASQFIDIASEEAKCEYIPTWQCEPRGVQPEVNKESILKVKQLLK